MRVPYIIGRWVCGRQHYGRGGVVSYLLTTRNASNWVIGRRCMGKTSLLRHIERLVEEWGFNVVPLFWDMQGCTTSTEPSAALFMAIEDERLRSLFCAVSVPAPVWGGRARGSVFASPRRR
jgi:hypothetical protein